MVWANHIPIQKSCRYDMFLTKYYAKMTLIVMCLEDVNQHIWRNDVIGIVVHDLQDLTYRGGWEPHSKANIIQGIHFFFMLMLVHIHQQ